MEEQSKKLSKTETELYANKYLKQQEAARVRAKNNAKQRKEAGIKLISVNVPEDAINRFKNLLRRTNVNKTTLFMHMINLCEQSLDEQSKQQQLRQPKQPQDQQQIQYKNEQGHNTITQTVNRK